MKLCIALSYYDDFDNSECCCWLIASYNGHDGQPPAAWKVDVTRSQTYSTVMCFGKCLAAMLYMNFELDNESTHLDGYHIIYTDMHKNIRTIKALFVSILTMVTLLQSL